MEEDERQRRVAADLADEFDSALQSEIDRRKAWMLEEEERRRRMAEGQKTDNAHTAIMRDVVNAVNAKVANQVKARLQPHN